MAQLVKVSKSDLCHVECPSSEPGLHSLLSSVLSTFVLHQIAPIFCLLDLNIGQWLIETQAIATLFTK